MECCVPSSILSRCQLWEDPVPVTLSVLVKVQTQARFFPFLVEGLFLNLVQARQVAARTALIYLKTLTGYHKPLIYNNLKILFQIISGIGAA